MTLSIGHFDNAIGILEETRHVNVWSMLRRNRSFL